MNYYFLFKSWGEITNNSKHGIKKKADIIKTLKLFKKILQEAHLIKGKKKLFY